jgi:hypothetical protein
LEAVLATDKRSAGGLLLPSMHFISSRLKKLDVHVKTVDVANEQTVVGAVITLICAAVTILLIVSEITLYMSKDVIHHLVVDQGGMGHDIVRLDFDFEFPKLACKGLSYPSLF